MRGSWQNIETYPRSPSGPRRDPQQNQQCQFSRHSTPDILVFRRTNDQGLSEFVPYERRIPQPQEQSSSNTVGVSTTDDSMNELFGDCPLNEWGLQNLALFDSEAHDLFSINYILPTETPKRIEDRKSNSG